MPDRVKIREMEAKDVLAMFGHSLPQTCQGWAVDLDGVLACIAGVIIQKPLVIAFSIIRPGLDISGRAIWRTALQLWENIKGLGHPELYAIAQPGLASAPAFLKRLGFNHIESGVRGDVYRWQTL